MKPSQFIGREAEMIRLKGLLDKRSASLIVVRGRRRIGKSRLLAEFGKEMKSYFFSGIPPFVKRQLRPNVMILRVSLRELVFVESRQMTGVISFGISPRRLKEVGS